VVKVVSKTDPEEPVGVLCLRNGKAGVVEYSEIDKNQAKRRDPVTGTLVYNSSHICINLFTLDFLQKIADHHTAQLPFHIAKKKINCLDANGVYHTPTEVNGWKLEMFIFDSFEFADRLYGLEVPREDEFAPLKNGPAASADSPTTCRRSVSDYCRRMIAKAGGTVRESLAKSDLVEISPLVSYSGEDLEGVVAGKTYESFPVLIQ